MSPTSRLVPVSLRLTRAGRVWRSADALHEAVAERAAPAPAPVRVAGLRPRALPDLGMPAVRFARVDGSRDPVLLLHGGGYVFDIVGEHWGLAAGLANRTGRPVVVLRYPLAPVGTAAQVVPAVAAAAMRLQQEGRLAIVGDSAGGGLALAVAMRLRESAAPPPVLVLSSPWGDIGMTDPAIDRIAPRDPWLAPAGLVAAGDLWRGDLPRHHPWVSPLRGDFAGMGPMTVFTGTRDVLNPDARALVPAARAAGGRVRLVEAAGLLHNFPLMPIPEGRAARDLMVAALR